MSQASQRRRQRAASPCRSASRNLRKKMHDAVGPDLRKECGLIDLPVDGNGRARLKMRQERREPFAEPSKQLAHVCGLDLEFAHAAGELAQVANQGHMGHRMSSLALGAADPALS